MFSLRRSSAAICGTTTLVALAALFTTGCQCDREHTTSEMDQNRSTTRYSASTNSDRDFALSMMRHHQGAIEMGRIQANNGTRADVRALATRIADTQVAESTKLMAIARDTGYTDTSSDATRYDGSRNDALGGNGDRYDSTRSDATRYDGTRQDGMPHDTTRRDAMHSDTNRSDTYRTDANRADVNRENAVRDAANNRTGTTRTDINRTDVNRADTTRNDANAKAVLPQDVKIQGATNSEIIRIDSSRIDSSRYNSTRDQFTRYNDTTQNTTPQANMPQDVMHDDKSSANMTELKSARGTEVDRLYLTNMITHHERGVKMTEAAMPTLRRDDLQRMARTMIVDQNREVEQMRDMLNQL